jgi:hypothetical protein
MGCMCFNSRVNPLGRVKAADATREARVFIPLLSPAPYGFLVARHVDVLVVCRSHG